MKTFREEAERKEDILRSILRRLQENGFINVLQWRNSCDYLWMYMNESFIEKQKVRELKSLIEELEYAEYNVTETRISALNRIYKFLKELGI